MVRIFCLVISDWATRAERWVTYEVNADGRDVALGVGVVGEPEEQAGLSDAGVADKQELEEVVVPEMSTSVSIETSRSHVTVQILNRLQQRLGGWRSSGNEQWRWQWRRGCFVGCIAGCCIQSIPNEVRVW